jgi:hypothetical protein
VRTLHRCACIAGSVAALAIACAPGGDSGDTTTAAGTTAAVNLADVAGTWNIRSVPETGDTTAVNSTLTATADTTGWTLTLQGRPPIPVRVRVEGDSIITVAGPYESILRAGTQVTTTSVYRLQNGMLDGRTMARYATTGADSVLNLRSMGHKAP